MNNSSKTQLGYFIDYQLWQDALALLNLQIEQKNKKKPNRHFNTISMFYYEKLDRTCLDTKEYFDTKIASSLFYGLKKEFSVLSYLIPKPGLGLRDHKFFTYPMKAVYYAVGLYLLKLSQQFLKEINTQFQDDMYAFYGGNLHYKDDGKLELSAKSIYFYSFYQKYRAIIKKQKNIENLVAIKIDVENYFNELSIPKLLHCLSHYIKPSMQAKLSYDIYTKEQLICFFQFIANNQSGIPQSDNNIISSFIGYLYLVFGDLFIDEILRSYRKEVHSHKIIRYTDDIHLYIEFNPGLDQEKQSSLIHLITTQIAEILYSKLDLKLNYLKTDFHRLSNEVEKEKHHKSIRESSLYLRDCKTIQEYSEKTSETPQEKLNKIFEELKKIKESKVEDHFLKKSFVQNDILREICDPNVDNILSKKENKKEIKLIFNNFNFNLVKIQPRDILIVLLKDETVTDNFRKFCIEKSIVTTGDADLIIKFLCQTKFEDEEVINKLRENIYMKEIVEIFMNKNINCEQPGYHNLRCIKINKLSKMPDVLEQTKQRVLSEKNEFYSVALNHLVNEVHAVCFKQDNQKKNKNNYDVNDVIKFLRSKGVKNETWIKVRNLFDRRNSNSVSHPGSDENRAWGVTKEEYLDYYNHVGKCLDLIL